MSDAAIIAIVTGGLTTLGTLLNTALTIWMKAKVSANSRELQTVHKEVNSKMTELLQAQKEAEHAKGKLEGMREEKLENKK